MNNINTKYPDHPDRTKRVEGPAQLWLGTHGQLELEALSYLQQQFCPQSGCGICITCTQIYEKQHHAVLWIEPEKQYTLETLEPIRTTCAYALEHNELFFFVLKRAELLSVPCQNSLLKTIEEPPAGFHFIFLAGLKDSILPTIKSRCVIKEWAFTKDSSTHPLFTFFSTSTEQDPGQLLKILEEHKPNEQESTALVNQLLHFWLTEFKRTAHDLQSAQHAQTQQVIKVLNQGLLNLPMPGGSALFWKNIYLQWQSQ